MGVPSGVSNNDAGRRSKPYLRLRRELQHPPDHLPEYDGVQWLLVDRKEDLLNAISEHGTPGEGVANGPAALDAVIQTVGEGRPTTAPS